MVFCSKKYSDSNFKKFVISLVVFVILGCSHKALAQTDTRFWFVAPEVSIDHGDRPIAFRVTSEAQPTQIRIFTPANTSIFDTTFSLPANSTTTIPLTHRIALIENDPPNQVHNRGFLIESSQLITAYYEVITAGNNPDIFALKGRNALGTGFYLPGQNLIRNVHGHERIDIVATEDSTVIQIENRATLFRSGGNINPGTITTITLNRGQTYSLRTNSQNANVSQAGSRIWSNKPIAITYTDDSVRGGDFYGGGCFDLLGDQLIPTALLGQEYIVMRGFLNAVSGSFREIVMVTAVNDSTNIFLNGGSRDTTLQRGQTAIYLLNDSSLYIQSTEPIYVAHISGFGCETGLAVLPSISCTGSRQVGFTRTTNEFFGINLMTKTANTSGFLLNGNPLPAGTQFRPVPGTGGVWQFTRLDLNQSIVAVGTGNLITNTSGPFHMGVINGGASTGCRYGYFSDFARYEVQGSTNSPPGAALCQGSTLELYSDSIAGGTYAWTNPAGSPFSSLRNPIIPNMSASDTGIYLVRVIVDGCNSEPDTVRVSMKPLPGNPNASNDGPYCVGDTIRLLADSLAGTSYQWTGPNGFSSTLRLPLIPAASLQDTGVYQLQLTRDGCVGPFHQTRVVVHPIPSAVTPSLQTDSLCPGDTARFTAPVVAGATYRWTGPGGFSCSSRDTSFVVTGQSQSGIYRVQVVVNNCESAFDSVRLTVVPGPIQVSLVQGNLSNCGGDTARLQVQAVAGYRYQWLRNNLALAGDTLPTLLTTQPGAYRLLVSAPLGCSDTSVATTIQFTSTLPQTIQASIQPPIVCQGDSIRLSVPGGYQYQWLVNGIAVAGATDSFFVMSTTGQARVQITDTSGCNVVTAATQVQVVPQPNAGIRAVPNANLCNNDSLQLRAMSDSLASFQWLRNDTIIAGATDSVLQVTRGGAYKVIFSYASGCSDTSSAQLINAIAPINPQVQAVGPTTACAGDTLLLRALGNGTNRQWFLNNQLLVGQTDSLLRATQPGQYRVRIANAQGCFDTSASISLQYNQLPNPIIQLLGNDSLCVGQSSVLRSSGMFSYQWLRNNQPIAGATDSAITVSQPGIYRVIGGFANGCSDTSASLQLFPGIAPNPVIQLQGNGVLCAGTQTSLQLSVAAGSTFSWFRNDTLLSSANSLILTTSIAGNYHVVAQSSSSCTDTSNVISIQVNPLPSLAIQPAGPQPSFCTNDSLLLRANGQPGYVYQWLRNGTALAGATADSVYVQLPGNYSVVVTDTNNCSAVIGPLAIAQLPLPSLVITANRPTDFCVGDSVRLEVQAAPNQRYQWFRNQTALLNDTLPQLQVTQSGSYSVRVAAANGCVAQSTAMVLNAVALPVSTVVPNGNQQLCAGDTMLLNGPAGSFTYQWLRNGTVLSGATAQQLSATQAGQYQLIVINSTGCRDTSAATVLQIRPLPVLSIANQQPLQGCLGDSVLLVLNSRQPSITYSWLRNGSPIGFSGDSLLVLQTGLYSLQATDTFGCVSRSNALQVIILPPPAAILANSGPLSLCEGSSARINVQPVLGSSYQWFRDGVALPGATQSFLDVTDAGMYDCELTSTGGCNNRTSGIQVNVLPRPAAAVAGGSQLVCAGADLVLEANMVNGVGFAWTGPNGFQSSQQSPIIANAQARHSGWYVLRTLANGCSSEPDSIFVLVEPALPNIDVKGRTRICSGLDLVLDPGQLPGARYTWFLPNGDSLVSNILIRNQVWMSDSGSYRLRVDRGACSSELIEIPVQVNDFTFYFPTAFTPNGDGKNEAFFPVTSYRGDYDLRIFDRWGIRIFFTKNPQDKWDGSIQGEPAQPGAYSYVLTYEGCRGSQEVVYGTVFLLR